MVFRDYVFTILILITLHMWFMAYVLIITTIKIILKKAACTVNFIILSNLLAQ